MRTARDQGRFMTAVVLGGLLATGVSSAEMRDYVANGDFEEDFIPDGTGDDIPAEWEKVETRPEEGSTVSWSDSNGPSLDGSQALSWSRPNGGVSGDWSAVEQKLDIDASGLRRLEFHLDVLVGFQNLEAGGCCGFEWPVIVEIRYELQSSPGTMQTWRHGWYIDPPGDGRVQDDRGAGIIPVYRDTLVEAGLWTPSFFDLLAELPDVGRITQLLVGGSGWSFRGRVDNVAIIGEDEGPPRPSFQRADANADGGVNLTDAIFTLNYLFVGGEEPPCEKSADPNDTGGINVTSVIFLLNYLFVGGPEPPAPFPDCGTDPSADALTCKSFPPCP